MIRTGPYAERERERKRQVRRLILIGRYIEAQLWDDPTARERLLDDLDGFLWRPRERELFGLLPLPAVCPRTCGGDVLSVHMCWLEAGFHRLTAPLWDDFHKAEERGGGADLPWSDFRNLPVTRLGDALEIMEDTVDRAEDRKRANGVRAGNKVKKPVCHYALYWPPDETPDRTEMARAVASSLKALGLDDRQALVLAHGDRDHPHVHVIANRVDPETGMAGRLGSATKRPWWEHLDRWAERHHPGPLSRSERDWAEVRDRLRHGADPNPPPPDAA